MSKVLLLAGALLSSSLVHAAAPTTTVATPAAPEKDRLTVWGVLLDGGLPDGMAASLVVRPFLYLRADAGMTYNLANKGVRAGVTLVPFRFAVVPTLRLEVGRAFEANVAGLAKSFGNLSSAEAMVLRRIGYDYASAQIGLEFGSQNRFLFFLRAGLAYVSMSIGDFQAALRENLSDQSIEASDPKIRGTIPSVNAGFLVFLF